MRIGYELLDSRQVSFHKLISNKREWNNCFIKYQTLDKNTLNFVFYRLEFLTGHFKRKFSVIKLSVSILAQTIVYRIYTVSREPIRLPESQYTAFGI